ncbi:hypothetical protein [Candidatus Hodarchaeum mangrovi]
MVENYPKNHLKEQIESEEMIFKTKVLDVRSQVYKKIEKAQKNADKDYQMKLKEIEAKKENYRTQLENDFKKLVNSIEKEEEIIFQEINEKYKQREEEVIEKILKSILP